MKKTIALLVSVFTAASSLFSQISIKEMASANYKCLASQNSQTLIITDSSDNWLVQKSAELLQHDISSVTGIRPSLIHTLKKIQEKQNIIIIGTISSSPIIKQLIATKKITTAAIENKWEAFSVQTISHPNATVIIGSDKRGVAYGVFELSKQIGVSPWYWWADVPVKKKQQIYIKQGVYNAPSPSVKYRGIFINDEAPAFSGWAKEKFGGINHLVYEKVFELLLRLKANYLWPAMWGNAFNDDDTLNPVLADKYGIVMGTSHHEPMLRSQQEWKRYGKGAWDYTKNDSTLRIFWQKGIENMKSHESIVTIGMRGDGDKPMTQGTATALLEKIVSDQRNIIEKVTNKPAKDQPQLWALYKEVQDYYDKGMRVPDDVTLLLCDDNWGNIRKLPILNTSKRSGGYGIYYHFDYVGGPRNYKWINTNNISRVWEQMHLAYEYGVDKIWVVNVGDIKPMELPINFFLDYAYDVSKWNEKNILQFFTQWAGQIFDKTQEKAIGKILERYSQLASRRKPELLDAKTYSLENYNEFNAVVKEFKALQQKAEYVYQQIDTAYKNAYFQLVLHPVNALSNLHNLYYNVALNINAAKHHQPNTNLFADKVKQYYIADSLLSREYNQLNNGKWSHMMDQTHIGYTYWQQPSVNKMPNVEYLSKDSIQTKTPTIKAKDYSAKKLIPFIKKGNIFFELNGIVSINAANYTKKINTNNIEWNVIPDIGRNSSGISAFPVNAIPVIISTNSPHLQYELYTYDSGSVILNTFFSPTLNFNNSGGLKCAISVDDEQPQIININEGINTPKTWGGWVANNIIIKTTQHIISQPGKHVIKFWMIDPGIVLQKIVADLGGLLPSYLGPNETRFNN
jgi:hypothetical protein